MASQEQRKAVIAQAVQIADSMERDPGVMLAGPRRSAGATPSHAEMLAKNEALRDLLRRAWAFPDYPAPADGCFSDAEDATEQESWRAEWQAMNDEVRAQLGEGPA